MDEWVDSPVVDEGVVDVCGCVCVCVCVCLSTSTELLQDGVAEVVGDDVCVCDAEVGPEGFLDVGLFVDGQVCEGCMCMCVFGCMYL